MENARLSGKVVWVIGDIHGKRDLDFDWYQVAKKSSVVGLGSGKNHGIDHFMDSVCEETS
jgi:hypothetical protein